MRDSLNALLEFLQIQRQTAFSFGKLSGWLMSSRGRPNLSVPALRIRRFKQVGLALAVLLLILLVSATFLVFRGYREGQEIRDYVGGPFSSQLLYLQGCVASGADGGGQADVPATLEEQFNSCRQLAGGRPGYYVYDFNIRRSVALSRRDMKLWREYDLFAFPDSVSERVGKSQTNPFNSIILFEEFTGFDYDCALAEDGNDISCNLAPVSCSLSSDAIRCSAFNPHTEGTELHVIERNAKMDLLVPQGFIAGPDLFKLLKPRFFPVLDRM